MYLAATLSIAQDHFTNAWQLARSRHHLLPAVHDELLQALGCSSKAVQVVAAAVAACPMAGSPDTLCTAASAIYASLVLLKEDLLDPGKGPRGAVGAGQQQWLAAEQKLHLLLPSVLLLNEAETPSGAAKYVDTCLFAGQCSSLALKGWRKLAVLAKQPLQMSKALPLEVAEEEGSTLPTLDDPALLHTQQQQQQAAAQRLQAEAEYAMAVAGTDQELATAVSDLRLVAAQVEEAMHLSARYILPQLLLLCQADMLQCDTSSSGPQANTDGSSRSSSRSTPAGCRGVGSIILTAACSSSSSSSDTGSCSTHAEHKQAPSSPHEALQNILKYLCLLNNSPAATLQNRMNNLLDRRLYLGFGLLHAAQTDAAAGKGHVKAAVAPAADSVTAASHDVAAAWSQDAALLCGSVEGYVRLQAARPSGGALAEQDCGLAMLCGRYYYNGKWADGGLLQAALAAGPGSSEQAQLFGLLCSLLKFASQLPPKHEARLTDAVLAAALAAASILAGTDASGCVPQQQQQPDAAQASAVTTALASSADAAGTLELSSTPAGPQKPAADVTAAPSASALTAASDAPSASSSTAAVNNVNNAAELLPWLVLFGRCCSIWAEQLLQGAARQHPQGPTSMYMLHLNYSTLLDVFTQRRCPMSGALLLLLDTLAAQEDPSKGGSPSGRSVPVLCLDSCKAWLSDPSTSAQLAAAGYDMQLLTSKLDAALQAADAVQDPGTGLCELLQMPSVAELEELVPQAAATAGHIVSAEAVMQLVEQLRAFGAALSTLAISSACNNPACSNVSGPSEAGLVKGSSSTCGGCRTARYCCRACQTQHWKLHKPVCKALAAARAGLSVS
jgi:hypothetical protein